MRFNDPLLVAVIDEALAGARAQADVQAARLLPGVGASASAQRSRSGSSNGARVERMQWRSCSIKARSLRAIEH